MLDDSILLEYCFVYRGRGWGKRVRCGFVVVCIIIYFVFSIYKLK